MKLSPFMKQVEVEGGYKGFYRLGVHKITFTVEDNGIGFDEKYLDVIFKPFQRLHGKESPYPGTGMGLAICRKILEFHGGGISAISTPGKGSTFIVKLPKIHRESDDLHRK